MTRFLSSSAQAASEASELQFRLLAQIDVRSSTLNCVTGNRFVTVGATTYTPVGHLGGCEQIQEDAAVFPRAVRLWLAAVGSVDLAEPISEALFNKPVRLYRGYVAVNSQGTLVSTPEMVFNGRINRGDIKLKDAERGNHYEIEVESRLRKKGAAAYFTLETHWTMMGQSGDTFFSYLDEVSRKTVKWGTGTLIGYRRAPRGGELPVYGPSPIDLEPRG